MSVRKTKTSLLIGSLLASPFALTASTSSVAAAPTPIVSVATPGTIHFYVEQGNLARVKAMLAQNPKLKEQHQSFLGTPLAVAAADGRLDIVRYLISQKAYVNARCADEYDSQTVLMAACTGGKFPEATRMAIVKALVDAGALVRVVDRSGYTALHTAAYYGHPVIVNYLVDKGADMLALDQDGRTPFTEALRGAEMWDDWPLMRFVRVEIAQGANVNAHTASGETMLSLAAQADRVHTIEYLLLQGADINARDRSGRTALDIALQHSNTDAAKTLQEHGAKNVNSAPATSATPAPQSPQAEGTTNAEK